MPVPSPMINPLLYPQSRQPFSQELFRSPTSEYRDAPFWAWNSKLDKKQIKRQVEVFHAMGCGAFHMHVRAGLDTEYMGDEFMQCIRLAVEYAAELGMLACLYDEDAWPSGCCGGLVTRDNDEFQGKHLLFTKVKYGLGDAVKSTIGHATGVRTENGFLLARYEITLEGSLMVSSRRLQDHEEDGDCWFAYCEAEAPSEWFNGSTYVDTLSSPAIAKFIETTHEVYYNALGDNFGTVCPDIFTDEPQFEHKAMVHKAADTKDYFMPWTADLPATFQEQYGYDLLQNLPDILWDRDEPSVTRYHFHDHTCERFVSAYMDQLADWCRKHGIALTGHMMREPGLYMQSSAVGECMRSYRNLDIPGIDMLCDNFEYNTAKQATSVHRQNNGNRGGVMSEEYGVAGYNFSFTEFKVQGDWQAALGVTFRVPHLSPMTLLGEAKRDYGAMIFYQSPWYKEYKLIADHFGRLNTVLTRGLAVTRVAVIHPIESFWLCYGPKERNSAEQAFREKVFIELTDWLTHGLVDFDFISESLFPEQTRLESIRQGLPLAVGHARYDVVIVPHMRTIRSTTLERLVRFEEAGGQVLVAGERPSLVDAKPSTIPTFGRPVLFDEFHILQSLESVRDVQVSKVDGTAVSTILYQLRREEDRSHLFLCNIQRKDEVSTEVTLKGSYGSITVMDTSTGKEWPLQVDVESRPGFSRFKWHFESASSVLLRLEEESTAAISAPSQEQEVYRKAFRHFAGLELERVELSEPNVLLLDKATFTFKPFARAVELSGKKSEELTLPQQPVSEILRIDNWLRKHLKLPTKTDAFKQPYAVTTEERQPFGLLTLSFGFESAADIGGKLELAVEKPETMTISLDGVSVSSAKTGWWVDEDISTVALPTISKGRHVIDVALDFGILTNLERIYILGDFSVDLFGSKAVLGASRIDHLTFGDWTRQGLPFYAGNLTYHCRVPTKPDSLSTVQSADDEGGEIALEIPNFQGPVCSVIVDDLPESKQTLAFYPNVLYLGDAVTAQRRHTLSITCYNSLANVFGPIHLAPDKTENFSPNAWRTEHDWWTEEYVIQPMGVIQTPVVKVRGEERFEVNRRRRFWRGRGLD